jgi:hypothetical protein
MASMPPTVLPKWNGWQYDNTVCAAAAAADKAFYVSSCREFSFLYVGIHTL